MTTSFYEFQQQFPDDEACLKRIMIERYGGTELDCPKCGVFYAMFLFSTSRHGVAAKELERQLQIPYKTAWRMAHEIRKYMAQVDDEIPLRGEVEADETYVGGKTTAGKRGRGAPNKTVVFGMLERGGDVMAKVVPDVEKRTLQPIVSENIEAIHTDELRSYRGLDRAGYRHRTVNNGAGEYVCHGSPTSTRSRGFGLA